VYMKKLLSILFLFIFLFNLAGYYIVFTIMQQTARKEMKAFIKKNPPLDKLERLVISDEKMNSPEIFKYKDDNKEIIYNGKLYDIVCATKDGSNTIFYCINDKNEEQLFAGLNDHIKQNFEQNGPLKKRSIQLIKNIIKEVLPVYRLGFMIPNATEFIYPTLKFLLSTKFILVISPPPKTDNN
jgi:hypothetical protein